MCSAPPPFHRHFFTRPQDAVKLFASEHNVKLFASEHNVKLFPSEHNVKLFASEHNVKIFANEHNVKLFANEHNVCDRSALFTFEPPSAPSSQFDSNQPLVQRSQV